MGTYQSFKQVVFSASSAKTANGNGTSFTVSGFNSGIVYIDVTAVTGTSPTIDIKVEDSYDNSEWFTIASLTQITAAGNSRQKITGFGRYVRISWTVGGTSPSFTFVAKGDFKGNE